MTEFCAVYGNQSPVGRGSEAADALDDFDADEW